MNLRKKSTKPTDTELTLLRVLWQRGPCTVREVQEALTSERPMGYTTILKLLQIMTEKGLVQRDEQERAHVYRASQTQNQAQEGLVHDLVERAFGGSVQRLVQHALKAKPVSAQELAEIRHLLDTLEREA